MLTTKFLLYAAMKEVYEHGFGASAIVACLYICVKGHEKNQ